MPVCLCLPHHTYMCVQTHTHTILTQSFSPLHAILCKPGEQTFLCIFPGKYLFNSKLSVNNIHSSPEKQTFTPPCESGNRILQLISAISSFLWPPRELSRFPLPRKQRQTQNLNGDQEKLLLKASERNACLLHGGESCKGLMSWGPADCMVSTTPSRG